MRGWHNSFSTIIANLNFLHERVYPHSRLASHSRDLVTSQWRHMPLYRNRSKSLKYLSIAEIMLFSLSTSTTPHRRGLTRPVEPQLDLLLWIESILSGLSAFGRRGWDLHPSWMLEAIYSNAIHCFAGAENPGFMNDNDCRWRRRITGETRASISANDGF